ncbi:MAG: PPOX class F420-dependent oxidoreductase [Acidimicrobiia bacterium]
MDRSATLEWLGAQRLGVIATIKSDGRPQLSNVSYALMGDEVRVSVTADRAKTKNLRRDPRVSMHVTTPQFHPYVVVEGVAQLSEVTTHTDDQASDMLVEVYRAIAGDHPDWDDFRQAMVDERRMVLSFVVDRMYGTGP